MRNMELFHIAFCVMSIGRPAAFCRRCLSAHAHSCGVSRAAGKTSCASVPIVVCAFWLTCQSNLLIICHWTKLSHYNYRSCGFFTGYISRFFRVCLQGPVYQAMYDYDAQDDDEVGFQENDIVVNVEPIDEGWMFGTVERTGMRGMLPANYVERIQWCRQR